MLLGNNAVLLKSPGRFLGGSTLCAERSNWNKSGAMRNWYADATASMSDVVGQPQGYRPPYSWMMAQKDGGLASINQITGSGTFAAFGALGKNAIAALAGSGVLSASGKLVVAAVAELVGSGSITAAGLLGFLQAAADLTGSGELAADVDALGWLLGDVTGAGALAGLPHATGVLSAELTPFTELSPQNLASAVWSALATAYDLQGTMGEKLNDSGGAGNPWNTEIESGFTAGELMKLISAALAGELFGAATGTVTIRDVAGKTDRIVATVDADGNRLCIVKDVH